MPRPTNKKLSKKKILLFLNNKKKPSILAV